jgi:predicted nucleic acid-binding protein
MSRDSFFFPDNTVLNNFAIIHRMNLLADLIGDRGRWCATVKQECIDGARHLGLEEMAEATSIFGDPLYPRGADHINIRTLREKMAKPGEGPKQHLGEAETIVIMMGRGFTTSFFVTDDVGATREAKLEGIRVVSTWDILRLLVRGRRIAVEDFHGYADVLADAQRGRPPGWPSHRHVEEWLFS